MADLHEERLFHIVRSTRRKQTGSGVIAGFPIILHPDHGVFQPAWAYLHELATWSSLRIGTLLDIAYIICSWCNFLQVNGVDWDCPTEKLYVRWISTGGRSDPEATVDNADGAQRMRRRAGVVFSWLQFVTSGTECQSTLRSFFQGISKTEAGGSIAKPRFRAPRGPKLKRGRVWIPDENQAAQVLDALSRHSNSFIAERDWTLARTTLRTGLRAMGVASLTCSLLQHLLRSEGIIGPHARLALMANDRPSKVAIREALATLADKGRKGLIGNVTEKRGKSRDVRFELDIVRELLDHVWGERAALLRRLNRSPAAEDALWLTTKGTSLGIEAVKKLVRERGFRANDFSGGIHRLRAAFLTERAIDLVREARTKFGRHFDERALLLALAEEAGHDDPESLRPYLDRARVLSTISEGDPDPARPF